MIIHFQKQLGGLVIRVSKQDTQDSCPHSSAPGPCLQCHFREPEACREGNYPPLQGEGWDFPGGPVVKNLPYTAGVGG